MFQYANNFSYAVNETKNEILLSFRQRYPKVGDDGTVTNVDSEPVADIVLNRDGIIVLQKLLNEINLND